MKINSTALSISTIIVIWLVVVMTIVSEISESLHSFLAKVGGHHWVGKGITAVVVFILLNLIFSKMKESENVLKNTVYIVVSTVLGGLIIFGFFLWHFISG